MSLIEQAVSEVLNGVLDNLCEQHSSFASIQRKNIFSDPSFRNIRKKCDEDDVSMIIDRRGTTINSDDSESDSDEDPIMFMKRIAARRPSVKRDQDEFESDSDSNEVECLESKRKGGGGGRIEREYDHLPPIDKLTIHADENIPLKKFGRVTNVLDCLVIIESISNVALDFDTVVFDQERNAIGKVYDIMGQVTSPVYAMRFNSPEEANSHKIGTDVYYAPTSEQYTRNVFTDQLIKQKIADPCWDGEGECPPEAMVFSDDESEKRFMAKRRRQKGTSLSSNADDSAKEQSQCSGEKRLRGERRGKWRKGDGQQGPMNQNSNRGRGRFNRGNFASNNAGAPSGRGRGMMRGSLMNQPSTSTPQMFWNAMNAPSTNGNMRMPNPVMRPPNPYMAQNQPFFGGPPRFPHSRGRRGEGVRMPSNIQPYSVAGALSPSVPPPYPSATAGATNGSIGDIVDRRLVEQ